MGADKVTMEGVDKPGATGSEDYSAFVEAGMGQSVFFDRRHRSAGDRRGQGGRRAGAGEPFALLAPLPEPTIRAGVEAWRWRC
jgi:hippurate hydrolase